MHSKDDELHPDDMLHGADAIGAVLGTKRRRTYYLLENGKLPAFKLSGGSWTARRSTLWRHIAALEAAPGAGRTGREKA